MNQHAKNLRSVGKPPVQHNVLRNTYWLLALSMVPTVFGAALGVRCTCRSAAA
jgi:FtsH-binding integral membrane protein